MNNPNLMAEVVRQYNLVYLERQRLMKAMRATLYVRKNEVAEWYKSMTAEWIIPESTAFRYYFACNSSHTGYSSQKPTQYFRSAASKRMAIAEHIKRQTEWTEHYNGLPENRRSAADHFANLKESDKRLAKLRSDPVHPYAKAICAYGKMKNKMKVLDSKKQRLKNTLCQLNKMELGVKVGFGTYSYHACDRITSVTVGERTMKPKDFLDLLEFETAVFGES
jgi:hypothetical protein